MHGKIEDLSQAWGFFWGGGGFLCFAVLGVLFLLFCFITVLIFKRRLFGLTGQNELSLIFS